MKNKNSNTMTYSKKREQKNQKSSSASIIASMQPSQLLQLFEDELKDIYWAEKALTKAIPKMINKATSPELVTALTNHLAETETQISRLEQIFESIDKKAVGEKCDAMNGLIKESETIMESCESGPMRDAGIIAAAQKAEHYEIASYGTLRQFAETLGLAEAESLLLKTLNEEKAADQKLTEVAKNAINVEAALEKA